MFYVLLIQYYLHPYFMASVPTVSIFTYLLNVKKQGHMTAVRNLKPFILKFLLGISCITAFVLLDWGSFSD